MYTVFEEHLKTDKGKLLVSENEVNMIHRTFIVSSKNRARVSQQG
jgi:hypothetical protein